MGKAPYNTPEMENLAGAAKFGRISAVAGAAAVELTRRPRTGGNDFDAGTQSSSCLRLLPPDRFENPQA